MESLCLCYATFIRHPNQERQNRCAECKWRSQRKLRLMLRKLTRQARWWERKMKTTRPGVIKLNHAVIHLGNTDFAGDPGPCFLTVHSGFSNTFQKLQFKNEWCFTYQAIKNSMELGVADVPMQWIQKQKIFPVIISIVSFMHQIMAWKILQR